MKVCAVLPTYNEKDSIAKVLDILAKTNIQVLVVDDSSPDGTAQVVSTYCRKHKNIHLLSGKKEGLGKAYLRGFTHVMSHFDVDAVIMMDSDLSHDPSKVTDFIAALDSADFVIGSRYIQGGSIPDWSWTRRLISKFGNLFARYVGGLYSVSDCTSGYRAIKIDILKKIDFARLHTRGYAFLTTLLYECIRAGAKVKEIPITFRDRKYGETKLQRKDMLEFFFNVVRIRMNSSGELIKFLTVGAVGMVVNLFSLYMLVEMAQLDRSLIAPGIAIELSIISNFMLNDLWTFKGKGGSFRSKFLKYNALALLGVVINLLVYNLLLGFSVFRHIFPGKEYLPAQFFAILAVTGWNYFLSKHWAWK
jgi:dolichol-phosphate mannosyltransferase